ncbi:MAG: hypothetical protein IPM46_09620 [Flavobacteriales bacterium]|nr:hypothetical protein [Flavobacteriales bacterium]
MTTQKTNKDPIETVYLDHRTGQVVNASQVAARTKEKDEGLEEQGVRRNAFGVAATMRPAAPPSNSLGDAKRIASAKGGTDLNIT